MAVRWRVARVLMLTLGVTLLAVLVSQNDPAALLASIRQLSWRIVIVLAFPFALVNALDTLGWRFAFRRDRVPFSTLFSARLAGEAFNLTTPTASLGGEAIKAWLVRRDIPYEVSVPSLILAKTAEVIGQALLLLTGIVVAWSTGIVGWSLLGPMCYLLIAEVIAITGFIGAQVAGGVGRLGRLLAWTGVGRGAQRVDGAVRTFYRSHWRALLASIGGHLGVESDSGAGVTVLILLPTVHSSESPARYV